MRPAIDRHRTSSQAHSRQLQHIDSVEEILDDAWKRALFDGLCSVLFEECLRSTANHHRSGSRVSCRAVRIHRPSMFRISRKEDGKLYPASPGTPVRISDMLSLKCSVLTAASYVSLCLNDFVSAKNYAISLLEESRASAGHK